jgi:zinc-ribbon domain
MPQSLLKLGLSGNSEIEFFQNFLIYKGERVLYSDVDGIAYLYTRTRRSINFIPVGTSHSYYVSIKARGVAHKITFTSERNQDVFNKLANAVGVLIKPFVIVNLLLDYIKNNRLEIGGLTITPEGISRKRTLRSPEVLPWNQFHNAVINQGKVSVFKKDSNGKYKLFGLPITMSSTNAVILPDILGFLFAQNGVLDEATRKQVIERKTQLSAMSVQDATIRNTIEDLTANPRCAKCGEKMVEESQKFCGKCGSSLITNT